jgi:hypothetical protein
MVHVGKYVDWRLIPTAPVEEDVELFVADVDGSLYALDHPCRRTAKGWVTSDTRTPLTVRPVRWKPYNSPRSQDRRTLRS